MSHCIQVIIAPFATADSISSNWPELPRLNRDNGCAFFPVDAEVIDSRIAPDTTPTEMDDEFLLLTTGFRSLLRNLSCGGQLAYVETDYFGGNGGQGAVVCQGGVEIMRPTWCVSGVINEALKLIGLKRGFFTDRFAAAGLADIRCNDDILALIARQTSSNDA